MKSLLATSLATIYGLSAHYIFSMFPGMIEIMGISFLFLVPIVIGFITVHFMAGKKNFSQRNAFFWPWVTSFALLVITILLDVEGLICWIMIYPLFSIVAGFGGVFAFSRYKKQQKKTLHSDDSILDDLDKTNKLQISILMLFPLAIGLIEGNRVSSTKEYTITQTIEIAASPSDVWYEILHIGKVGNNEKSTPVSDLIGFPQHLNTTLDTAAVGGKRMAYYQNGLFFEETITKYEAEHKMILDIFVDPNKVPPTVMDEHIVIGGKHIDLLEDEYTLTETKNGFSNLKLSSHFKINTPFNWYAGFWAKFLMNDLLKGELKLIQQRVQNKIK